MTMDSFLPLFALGVMLISYVNGQSTKAEWTAAEFYNPWTDSMMCGFPTNQTAYICDPNGILSTKALRAFNRNLHYAMSETQCPCSTFFCESGNEPKGYKVSVALVKRMKKYSIDGKMQSPEDMAVKFSEDLRTKKWKRGNCEEDIIIFYSVDDKMLSIDPGRTAAIKLNRHNIELMAEKIAGRLNDGQVIEALNLLLYDMKIILNCDLENPYDCTIYEAGTASSLMSSTVLLITMVTFVLVYLMRH